MREIILENISGVNRIGIFSLYDKDAVVDKYVEFLLRELCHCLSHLVVVINGEINDEGKLIIEKYADEIYIRENTGFDGGAYKDVIVNVLGWKRIQEFDELVLCNDTFYGPFISFESIFDEMKNESIDFWGLNYYYNKITNHIQSYFLVFRKKIINESNIMKYFNEKISLSTNEITDVYNGFELGLFQYLVNQGYSFAAYSENNPFDLYYCSNIGIKEFGIPILKKKAFSPECFIKDNAMDALKFLSQNSDYDLELILDNIRRIYNLQITKQEIEAFNPDNADIIRKKYDVARISEKNIKGIISMGKKLYVYGLGAFAGKISKIIDIYNGKIDGYIVSDDQLSVPRNKDGVNVYKVSEVDRTDDMVIIVALGKKYTREVASYLSGFKKVVFLW